MQVPVSKCLCVVPPLKSPVEIQVCQFGRYARTATRDRFRRVRCLLGPRDLQMRAAYPSMVLEFSSEVLELSRARDAGSPSHRHSVVGRVPVACSASSHVRQSGAIRGVWRSCSIGIGTPSSACCCERGDNPTHTNGHTRTVRCRRCCSRSLFHIQPCTSIPALTLCRPVWRKAKSAKNRG